MSISKRFAGTVISRSLQVIDHRDRVRLFWISLIQTSLGLLDLLGIMLIGAIGALSIQGIESKKAGNHVGFILRLVHLQNFSFQSQVIFLGVSAAGVLILKTLLSVFFTRRTFKYLSHRGARLSADLVSKVLSQKMVEIQARTTQQTLYMVTAGVKDLLIGTLGTAVNLLSDFSMLIIIATALFLVDPITAIATVIIFGAIGYLLYRLMQVKAQKLGHEIAVRTIANDSKILEVLRSYRESVVRDRRGYYSREIGILQSQLGEFVAEANFMPFISKYVMDSATVISALILGGIVLTLNNAVHGVATLSIFLAASTRIATGALRVQQGLVSLKGSQGSAELTLGLVEELKNVQVDNSVSSEYSFVYKDFVPAIEIKNLNFAYSSKESFAIQDLTLSIKPGESVAFVGSSGAGKTTLIDLILGVLDPDSGTIAISGLSPSGVSKKWAGAVAYVPQDVVIVSGSISDNVRLGYPEEVASKESIERALDIAQLSKAVAQMESGIETFVGENGGFISGGQRQRLGIARALFTHPKLLVLDEATSALDGQTEAELTEAIRSLHGEVTVLVVAHRLSTVRHVDKVVYLNRGRIEAVGSFDEVRAAVPDFDRQAELMGL